MGQGRRMKRKQGMPDLPPQDKLEKLTKLKRKAGAPVNAASKVSLAEKRKTIAAVAAAKKPRFTIKNNEKAESMKKISESVSDAEMNELSASVIEDYDDDDGNDRFSEFKGAKNGDEFLGSENEDESVNGSDEEVERTKKEFAYSDEDESDREVRLTAANIAGLSKKLDEEQLEVKLDAEAELRETALQTNLNENRPDVFGGDDAKQGPPSMQLLRQRITDTVMVLEDFAKLGEPGRSRADYTAQIVEDISEYYGYTAYLAQKLYDLFPPREAIAFFEANETPRPVVLRTNTLLTHRRDLAQALINRGVTLEPVGKWSKVGLQAFESNVPLGATPEYLSGQYIIQAASSFLPVMALCPQPYERVLDMAAAPGGKTTHCAAMMKNTGVIFANDPNKKRAKGLIGNCHRLGTSNVVVCNYDAREFPEVMGGFDRVLLDAPCSGTGVIGKDASIKTNKTEMDFIQLPHTQKQLLLCAIDSAKTGGTIAYSTCSVTIEENEAVVDYALSKRPNVKLVETGLPFGLEGFTSYRGKNFDASLKMTRRYYPHTYNLDGFFVSLFKKTAPTPLGAVSGAKSIKGSSNKDAEAAFVRNGATSDKEAIAEKTPIGVEAAATAGTAGDDDPGFDDEEDHKYIERAERNAMRRRGLDPRALKKPKGSSSKEVGQSKKH